MRDITLGFVAIPLKEVAPTLFRGESDKTPWLYMVQKIRLPKAITAVGVGCSLLVSRLQMQTLFRNPLAGPLELEITAPAGLDVAVVMLAGGGSASLSASRQLGFRVVGG